MWEKLQEVFEEIGLPYSRQGSFGVDEKLPDSFFTFWNIDCILFYPIFSDYWFKSV